ncbi:hypothetical protein SPONL_2277 [uncultured Candidatus Thioglobus sp.]|nr:hypothetical protein SPONL_2277 [uncultured Candidatus Thioglobus sp.]
MTDMSHYIKTLNIQNFKCFDNFKVEGLARVNLITGKNNIGKTALMEAIGINVYAQDIKTFTNALASIKMIRETLNTDGAIGYLNTQQIKKYIKPTAGVCIESNINTTAFSIFDKDGVVKYNFKFLDKEISVNVRDFSFEIDRVPNIVALDNFGFPNCVINEYYSYLQKLEQEDFLNQSLNKFDERIQGFKIIDDKPHCKVNGKYVELTELGDGTHHLVSIIVALFASKEGYFLVDEIDNGVHFEKLDSFWEIILFLSKSKNIQVFATTHSKECIESYARVAQKMEDKDITLIELGKSDGELKNIVFNYEAVIDYALYQHSDIRGW